MKCLDEISDLLARNRLLEALEALEVHIRQNEALSNRSIEVISFFSAFDDTERDYRLHGFISRREYQQEKSELIKRVYDLAAVVCAFLQEEKKAQPKTHLGIRRLESRLEVERKLFFNKELQEKLSASFWQRLVSYPARRKLRKEALQLEEQLEFSGVSPRINDKSLYAATDRLLYEFTRDYDRLLRKVYTLEKKTS